MALPLQYETQYLWSGEGVNGDLEIDDRPALPVGSPINTKVYNPEHMLLGAAEVCLANTFFSLVEKARISLTAYRSRAWGELEFVSREGYRFHEIQIKVIAIVGEDDLEKARKMLDKAHNACLIARSLNCPVNVEAEFRAAQTAASGQA